jgi:hypothetical protein
VLRLGSRSVGRDNWGGWYLEYGQGNAGIGDTSYSTTVIGGGFRDVWLFGSNVRYGPDIALSVGSSSASGHGSEVYADFTLGFAVRIPIGANALTLEPMFFAGSRPVVYTYEKDHTATDNNGYSGVTVDLKWAFNFEN